MDLTEYVEALRESLTTAAAAGGEQSRETARLLAATIDPAVRLAVTAALAEMAAQVTAALDDGTVVDIRFRGRDPEVVVVPAPSEPAEHAPPEADDGTDDGAVARISLRLPDQLKARAESAAAAAGTSLNSWLVGAVAAAVRHPQPGAPTGRSSGRGPRHYSGFARS
jgi:hypothetical protein